MNDIVDDQKRIHWSCRAAQNLDAPDRIDKLVVSDQNVRMNTGIAINTRVSTGSVITGNNRIDGAREIDATRLVVMNVVGAVRSPVWQVNPIIFGDDLTG